MQNIVEKVCQSCVIREIPGIKSCIKMPKKQGTDRTVPPKLITILIAATHDRRQ